MINLKNYTKDILKGYKLISSIDWDNLYPTSRKKFINGWPFVKDFDSWIPVVIVCDGDDNLKVTKHA